MKTLVVSAPPHLQTARTTKGIMLDVVIALLPATVMGCILFGLNALWTILLSVGTAVLAEYLYALLARPVWKDVRYFGRFWKEFDFSSLVTGLLLALILPAGVPWYLPVLGSAFAIIAVKMLFGGTGKNIVNPAIAGRIFLFISFTTLMATYPAARLGALGDKVSFLPVTGATPLAGLLGGEQAPVTGGDLLNLLLGFGVGGCIGETCKVALLVGFVYLVVRRVVKFWQPLVYIGVTGLFAVALEGFDFRVFLPSILSGGLILGAVFMATDYVTSPRSDLGNLIYYIALGLLTAGLRKATGVEVVSFAILLMNIVVPLIDLWIPRRPFGYRRSRKEVRS